MGKQKAFEILSKRIDEWEQKPKSDGYVYEQSFLEVMQGLNEELLQLSVGELPTDRNKKNLVTQLGEITVAKGHLLEPTGNFRQSPYLQDTALLLGQGQVFEESSNLLKRLCGVSLKQIEKLCHHYGEEVESQLVNNESIVVEKLEELHYAMVDGSYILSRENGWTETKVRRIFKASSNFLLSEKRGSIQESEYVAHIGTHTDFIAKFSPLLDGLSRFVFIADGASWMWKWVADFYPDAVQVLDFFHAFEKICQWATMVYKDKETVNDWCENTKDLLLNDGIKEVVIQIQNMDCQGDTLAKKNTLLTYLNNNAHRMTYKTFLDKGYLIGSGAIESAQRTVVQHRLKRSGQRWTIKGGQQVLNFRTKNLSNKWNQVTKLVRMVA
jgi:hypothetical protein